MDFNFKCIEALISYWQCSCSHLSVYVIQNLFHDVSLFLDEPMNGVH